MSKEGLKKVLRKILVVPLGIIGLVLFRWTPATGKGFAIYGVLLVLLVVVAIILAPEHQGYWPDPPK
jgi:hypothetical protein